MIAHSAGLARAVVCGTAPLPIQAAVPPPTRTVSAQVVPDYFLNLHNLWFAIGNTLKRVKHGTSSDLSRLTYQPSNSFDGEWTANWPTRCAPMCFVFSQLFMPRRCRQTARNAPKPSIHW